MAKKCPPGVICFSNFVFVLLVGLILYVIYYFKTMEYKTTVNSNNHDHHHTHTNTMFNSFLRPNYGYTNLPNDVYLNPIYCTITR